MSLPIQRVSTLVAAAFAVVLGISERASADTLIIKRPGAHPHYRFEAEPHLLLGFVDPPGHAHGTGLGFGFRGTVELIDNGFVSSINNTVGLGFGIDYVHYSHGRERCVRPGMGNGDACLALDDEFSVGNYWIPIVMQWNFWLSRNWSVFGEPGAAIRYQTGESDDNELRLEPLQFYAGGRYHFSDTLTLTMRLGYPTFAIGVSFLL
jgi:hypothetical protein